ncbi:glucose transport transcription regulator RGT1 [Microdochium nivale]|nr:glucose transport transcription regulator RGT1 [Microdochium nivale]
MTAIHDEAAVSGGSLPDIAVVTGEKGMDNIAIDLKAVQVLNESVTSDEYMAMSVEEGENGAPFQVGLNEPQAVKGQRSDEQSTNSDSQPHPSLSDEEPEYDAQITQFGIVNHNEVQHSSGVETNNAGLRLDISISQDGKQPMPIELDMDDNHDLDQIFSDQNQEGHDQAQLQNHDGASLHTDDDLFIMDHHDFPDNAMHDQSMNRSQHTRHGAHTSPVDGSQQSFQQQPVTQPILQYKLSLPKLSPPYQRQHSDPYQQSRQELQASRAPSDGAAARLGNHYPGHDNVPPRKRSKVSRACDECRRKKVKCDAPPDAGTEPCSNCRRSSIICLFSRIPQKRGPSKGYIKELADRINNIEGKLASEGANADTMNDILGVMQMDSADLQPPIGLVDGATRKRLYSSMSGEFETPPRQTTWTPDSHGSQNYNTNMTASFANGMAPKPTCQLIGNGTPRHGNSMDDLSLDLGHEGDFCELNDAAFEKYLRVLHPSYPLLSSSRERVELMLSHCPALLRDAFMEALYGAIQSFVSAPGLHTEGSIKVTCRLITEWEVDTSRRTPTVQLVHLQTLILIAITTDNYGPLSLKGEHGGASKASILGRAVGLAYSMRLHLSSLDTSRIDTELDLDCEENIRVRSWWTLVMLDRWNAIASASPLFIPNDSVVLVPDMSLVLGESVYHLARLSKILGHFSPVALAPPQVFGPTSGAAPILSSLLNLSIELFREVLPADFTPAAHPILHLVYWHCRLLAYLYQGTENVMDILWPCKQSTDLLLTHATLLSPLSHHFFALTALSLITVARVGLAAGEANTLLRKILDSNLAPSTWDAIIRDRISEHLIRASLTTHSGDDNSDNNSSHKSNTDETNSTPSAVQERSATPQSTTAANAVGSTSLLADKAFDVQSLARAGYLNVLADDDTPHLHW